MRLLVLVLSILATPALAQDRSYTVNRGETVRIFSWSFFGESCKATDFPKIRVIRGGALGILSSGRDRIKIGKVADSRLEKCIGKTVEGTIVTYTAGREAGQETVRLARKRLNGKEARYDITISVK